MSSSITVTKQTDLFKKYLKNEFETHQDFTTTEDMQTNIRQA